VQEDHGLAYIGFADGTRGILESIEQINGDFALRLMGTDGFIDCKQDGRLRVLNGDGWQDVPVRSNIHGPSTGYEAEDAWLAALQALLDWLEGSPEPEVSARKGLATTELYLAAYESARRRDRVDLPLTTQAELPLDAIAEKRV
jgi:predicted dehydrogenase